jgi:predicted transport protein
VRLCVQHLRARGFVQLIDLFMFSNVYTATPGIRRLVANATLQAQCADFVSDRTVTARGDELLRLYAAMRAGTTIVQFCVQNQRTLQGLNVDVRRLVTFGLLHGFIRRVASVGSPAGSELT